MATINECADHIAAVIGIDPQDARYVARRLRESGQLPQAGRGRGGAQFSPAHVALLVLAIMATIAGERGGAIDRTAENLNRIAGLSHFASIELIPGRVVLPTDLVGTVSAVLAALAGPDCATITPWIGDLFLLIAGKARIGGLHIDTNGRPEKEDPFLYCTAEDFDLYTMAPLKCRVSLSVHALTQIAKIL